MASIRERVGRNGVKTYAVLFRAGDRQTSITRDTREEAEGVAALVEAVGGTEARRRLEAQARPTAPVTVGDAIGRHIDALSGVQAYTVTTYRTIERQVREHPIGSLPLDLLRREDVAAWIRGQQATGAAAKTIKNRQALLSAALTRAVDDELVERNVAARAKIARTERREMAFLTPAEFQIVLARASAHYRPLLMFLYGTGMRLGEATALRVGDVHLEYTPATVTVTRAWKKGGYFGPPKTAAGRRTLSLPGPVVEAIRPMLDAAPDALVFTNTEGRRIQQATLHDLWQSWIDDTVWDPTTRARIARVPRLGKVPRIHDLRHSHAAWMIGQGMSLYDLKQRLGHESIQTTADTYGHLMPEAQVQAERAASLAFPQIGR